MARIPRSAVGLYRVSRFEPCEWQINSETEEIERKTKKRYLSPFMSSASIHLNEYDFDKAIFFLVGYFGQVAWCCLMGLARPLFLVSFLKEVSAVNKIVAFFSLALALFLAALAVVPETASADRNIYAKVTPVDNTIAKWFLEKLGVKDADHAYVCVDKDGPDRCYSNTGRDSSGKELSGTRKKGDTDVPKCVHDEGDSIYGNCYIMWGVNGTCHQETNLGMMRTTKTVIGAKGYEQSKKMFGTYGKGMLPETCSDTCFTK